MFEVYLGCYRPEFSTPCLTPFFFSRLPQDAAMARWTIDMQPFNCTVKYFAGKRNIVADTLSRLRNEPNLLETLNKLPKITCIDDEVECHVTTRSQSKFNNNKVDKISDH